MAGRKAGSGAGGDELTPLELELMKVVWERGTATGAEVGAALADSRPLADTTIHTVLANLRKKGYLELVPTVERSLRFAPAVAREAVAAKSVWKVLGDFFAGSPQRLMAHLIGEGRVDEAELEEIRRMLGRQTNAECGGCRGQTAAERNAELGSGRDGNAERGGCRGQAAAEQNSELGAGRDGLAGDNG